VGKKKKEVIMKDIKDLEIYNDALNFSNLIWDICSKWDIFAEKTVGIQLVKSSDSISANIAEGYGRFHFKENLNFCYYSRGSFEEVKDWLRKSYYRDLIPKTYKIKIEKFISSFPQRLNSYINYIKKSMRSN